MSQKFFERHQALLEQALAAASLRGYWSPFAESPSPRNYGETANDDGRAAFEALQGKPFPLTQHDADGTVGGEQSPYGFDLGITYPHVPAPKLVAAAKRALADWRRAGPQAWVGVSLEILAVSYTHLRAHET